MQQVVGGQTTNICVSVEFFTWGSWENVHRGKNVDVPPKQKTQKRSGRRSRRWAVKPTRCLTYRFPLRPAALTTQVHLKVFQHSPHASGCVCVCVCVCATLLSAGFITQPQTKYLPSVSSENWWSSFLLFVNIFSIFNLLIIYNLYTICKNHCYRISKSSLTFVICC